MAQKRIALVTGGSRGIGFGCSLALARQGFDLVVAGRRPESDCAEALAELRQAGAEVAYAVCDVASAEDRAALLDAARRAFGRLHVLVNNAGVAPRQRADILEATEASFDEVINTNLRGPYFLTQAVARWMIEQQQAAGVAFSGCIINVSSISATVVSTSRGEYCLSKAGVSMATQLWAARLAELGINVYEIRPGVINTDMTSVVKEKYDQMIASGLTPIKRWGQPLDVANAVSVVCSGLLNFSTGEVINVDGGFHIRRL